MRIVNLIENTEGLRGCVYAHGLSFYIETKKHKLLVDLGPSEETLENASKLGIDLGAVDIVILSHGHYDHSGGIIPFSKINSKADIYMQRLATGDYYSDGGEREGSERYRYIGIDKEIADLSQINLLDGDHVIDEEVSVFVIDEPVNRRPFTNSRLKEKVDGSYIQDEFRHEQYVVITEGNRKILISGCAHNGILNILGEYERKYGSQPDAVISGFHLMKKSDYTDDEIAEIIDTAKRLKEYRTTFYTCHCTGVTAYESMRCIMGDQLRYVHSGEDVRLRYQNYEFMSGMKLGE
jgi:7,8-dihydropterin-6-yl-methyl-4-(beta-D-ribofuranosyl)aminobenzene 5'-phosphate synthase